MREYRKFLPVLLLLAPVVAGAAPDVSSANAPERTALSVAQEALRVAQTALDVAQNAFNEIKQQQPESGVAPVQSMPQTVNIAPQPVTPNVASQPVNVTPQPVAQPAPTNDTAGQNAPVKNNDVPEKSTGESVPTPVDNGGNQTTLSDNKPDNNTDNKTDNAPDNKSDDKASAPKPPVKNAASVMPATKRTPAATLAAASFENAAKSMISDFSMSTYKNKEITNTDYYQCSVDNTACAMWFHARGTYGPEDTPGEKYRLACCRKINDKPQCILSMELKTMDVVPKNYFAQCRF